MEIWKRSRNSQSFLYTFDFYVFALWTTITQFQVGSSCCGGVIYANCKRVKTAEQLVDAWRWRNLRYRAESLRFFVLVRRRIISDHSDVSGERERGERGTIGRKVVIMVSGRWIYVYSRWRPDECQVARSHRGYCHRGENARHVVARSVGRSVWTKHLYGYRRRRCLANLEPVGSRCSDDDGHGTKLPAD